MWVITGEPERFCCIHIIGKSIRPPRPREILLEIMTCVVERVTRMNSLTGVLGMPSSTRNRVHVLI
jgi:hypothetical protein